MAGEGLPLSRFEGDFAAAGGVPLGDEEQTDLQAALCALRDRGREDAIAWEKRS